VLSPVPPGVSYGGTGVLGGCGESVAEPEGGEGCAHATEVQRLAVWWGRGVGPGDLSQD